MKDREAAPDEAAPMDVCGKPGCEQPRAYWLHERGDEGFDHDFVPGRPKITEADEIIAGAIATATLQQAAEIIARIRRLAFAAGRKAAFREAVTAVADANADNRCQLAMREKCATAVLNLSARRANEGKGT